MLALREFLRNAKYAIAILSRGLQGLNMSGKSTEHVHYLGKLLRTIPSFTEVNELSKRQNVRTSARTFADSMKNAVTSQIAGVNGPPK
jgi:hypothetical protein